MCYTGYIGVDCLLKNIELSTNPNRSANAAVALSTKRDASSAENFIDSEHSVMYVPSNPLTVFDTRTMPFKPTAYITLPGILRSIKVADSSYIHLLIANTTEAWYRIPRGDQLDQSQLAVVETIGNASVSPSMFSVADPFTSDSTWLLQSDRTLLQQQENGAHTALNVSSELATVTSMKVSGKSGNLHLTGAGPDGKWSLVIKSTTKSSSKRQSTAESTPLAFSSDNVPFILCAGCSAALGCLEYGADRVLCIMADALGPVLVSFSTATPRQGLREQRIYYSRDTYQVTAMAIDEGTLGNNFALAAIHVDGNPSTILKIDLAESTVTGELALSRVVWEPEVVSSFTVSSSDREMLAVVPMNFQMKIISVNLFGVSQVTPNIVDAAGGTRLFVTGEGFFGGAGPAYCVFSADEISIATVVNSTTLICVAPGSSTSSAGGCVQSAFNIRVADRVTSTSNVPMTRPSSAIVVRAFSEVGEGFSDSSRSATIVLTGFGFIQSKWATCGLFRPGTTSPQYTMPATYLNSTAIRCAQPASLLPTKPGTAMRYSHDGQVYGTSSVPFALVGSPFDLAIASPKPSAAVAVPSNRITWLPPILVHVVDTEGNPLFNLDRAQRSVSLSAWHVDRVTNTESAVGFRNTTFTQKYTANGVAVFDRVSLSSAPRLGDINVQATHAVIAGPLMLATTKLVVAVGVARQVILSTDPALWVVGAATDTLLDPSPVAMIVDAGGNQVVAKDHLPASVQMRFTVTRPNEIDGSPQASLQTLAVTFEEKSSAYPFGPVAVRTTFGSRFTIQLDSPGVESSISQPISVGLCPEKEFGEPGTFTCRPCPPGGICDGSHQVRVQPGHWRAEEDAFTMYPCATGACKNGTCHIGYMGPKCSVCELGYAKTGKACDKCLDSVSNWVIICLITIAFTVAIAALVVSSQGDPTTDIGRERDVLPLLFKVLLSHIQVLAQSQYLATADSATLTNFFNLQQTAGTISVDFSFVNCEIGSRYKNYFDASQLLPPIFFTLAAIPVCFVVIRKYKHVENDGFDLAYLEEIEKNKKELLEDDLDLIAAARLTRFAANPQTMSPLTSARNAESGDDFASKPATPSAIPCILGSPANDKQSSFRCALPHPRSRTNILSSPTIHSFSDDQLDPFESFVLDASGVTVDDGVASPGRVALEREQGDSPRSPRLGIKRVATQLISNPAALSDEAFKAELREITQRQSEAQRQAEEEESARSKIFSRPLRSRIIESLALTIVVVLFLMYTSLLEASTRMLQCEDIDFGKSHGNFRSVLIADRSLSCDSEEYLSMRSLAIVLLLIWGLGTPIFSILIINVIRHMTLFGHGEAARVTFFYITGGFKPRFYFWEAVTMARKATIIIIVVLVDDSNLRAYCCVWAMLVFLVLHTTVLPYSDPTLSHLEAASLVTIFATFNLLMLRGQLNPIEDEQVSTSIDVTIYLINSVLFLAFFYQIVRACGPYVKSLIMRKDFLAFLRPLITDSDIQEATKRNAILREEAAALKQSIAALKGRRVVLDEACSMLKAYVGVDDEVNRAILDYQRSQRHACLVLTRLEGARAVAELERILDLEQALLKKLLEVKRKSLSTINASTRGSLLSNGKVVALPNFCSNNAVVEIATENE